MAFKDAPSRPGKGVCVKYVEDAHSDVVLMDLDSVATASLAQKRLGYRMNFKVQGVHPQPRWHVWGSTAVC
jgi:hypothetical protein